MNDAAPRLGAVILAAGASRRLGRSKQLILVDGETLIRRTVRAVLAVAPLRTAVVIGANAEETFRAVADLEVERVEAGDWASGMAASLRAGVDALGDAVDGLLVVLCDQPALSAAHLARLASAWRGAPDAPVASAYAGLLGVPAIVPRTWFAELGMLEGDRGARDLLRARSDRVTAVAAPALAVDIDEPRDLGAAGESPPA